MQIISVRNMRPIRLFRGAVPILRSVIYWMLRQVIFSDRHTNDLHVTVETNGRAFKLYRETVPRSTITQELLHMKSCSSLNTAFPVFIRILLYSYVVRKSKRKQYKATHTEMISGVKKTF